jgi:hypothetical protein
MYNDYPAASIVVTTYFSEKSGSFDEHNVVVKLGKISIKDRPKAMVVQNKNKKV